MKNVPSQPSSFKVPEEYFLEQQKKLLKQIPTNKKLKVSYSFISGMAAAIVLVGLFIFYINNQQSKTEDTKNAVHIALDNLYFNDMDSIKAVMNEDVLENYYSDIAFLYEAQEKESLVSENTQNIKPELQVEQEKLPNSIKENSFNGKNKDADEILYNLYIEDIDEIPLDISEENIL